MAKKAKVALAASISTTEMNKLTISATAIKALVCCTFFALANLACNPKAVKTVNDEPPEIIEAGGGRDEHGCIPSAGYEWSVALEKCVRLWEVGIELKNVRVPSSTSVAYLIVDPEKDKAELYLLEVSGSLILSKQGSEWVDSDKRYILTRNTNNQYQVRNAKGLLLYQSNQ